MNSKSPSPLPPRLEQELQRLLQHVRIPAASMRMWETLMTEKDRRKLRDEVEMAPRVAKFDDREFPSVPSEEVELEDGFPGKIFHRCCWRWGADGIWMRVKGFQQPEAIIDLAYELGMLWEPDRRRLLRELGIAKRRPAQQKRPVWEDQTLELRFEGSTVRRIRSRKVARRIVAILDAFEARNWPQKVDAPPEMNGTTLHDAVYSLNRDMKKLVFSVTGDGTQIMWERR